MGGRALEDPLQETRLVIGRIVKPQGRIGEVLVEPLSNIPERFATLRQVILRRGANLSGTMDVTACWPHKGRFVLKLKGVDSITAAEAWRDHELLLAGEAPQLPAGTYYHHQLCGLRVQTADGADQGEVTGVLETTGTPVLVCRGAAGETLIPLAEPFIRAIDMDERRIVVTLLGTIDAKD